MSRAAAPRFQPRKTPQQGRSAASVEAILQATVQVLLQHGATKLTTTRVAQRAGVSVGTLYQYFPNKSALLQALLRQKLTDVADAVEAACNRLRGATVDAMAEGVTLAFVHAKFQHVDVSTSLYAISAGLEGKEIAREMHARSHGAITAMLATARPQAVAQPGTVAETMLSAMAGVSRAMLEHGVTPDTMVVMQEELTRMSRAYLEASPKVPVVRAEQEASAL